MSNFYGNDEIILQPHDSDISYRFDFNACSAATVNDGYIPFGTTISGVSIISYNSDGEVITDLVQGSTTANEYIIVVLSYPSTSGDGSYKLTFILSITDGSTLESDFDRITAKDI